MSRIVLVFCALHTLMCGLCDEYTNGYTRIKRAKYYSNPPPRIYRLPPPDQPIRGPFSYTPPPEYMEDYRKPYKATKHRDGLGDEDIRSLIKHLSKEDFDKILEFAGERYTKRANIYANNGYRNDPNIEYTKALDDQSNYIQIKSNTAVEKEPKLNQITNHAFLGPEEIQQKEQISYLNGYKQQEFSSNENQKYRPNQENDSVYTNSDTMKEEQLPIPENLREESDVEISYTNNVPTVVKSETSSYKLENFANLPLMNYDNSQLEFVNSYSVPHFTVTQPQNQSPSQPLASSFVSSTSSSHSSPIQVEQSPPRAAAAQQSDAHLKATKIWTHKSTGTAYTLHDDGTLSLEKPTRPKRKY